MKTYKIEGVVIKRRNIGEVDRIVTMITRDHGKLQINAKGVRKITSRRSSHIELLNHVHAELHKGHLYPVLTEAQHFETFQEIKADLKKTAIAYHLCEIIDVLCPENQENRRIFFLFKALLHKMVEEDQIFRLVHAFEMDMLRELGYVDMKQISIPKPSLYIEGIIEKKLKSRQILPQLLYQT